MVADDDGDDGDDGDDDDDDDDDGATWHDGGRRNLPLCCRPRAH